MIRAQANEARQRRERYLFGDVFFNVSGYSALLPRSETAARRRFGATRADIAVHEVMGQHAAERFAIMLVLTTAFDQLGQFDRGLAQLGVFGEHAWRKGSLGSAGGDGTFGWVG